MPYSYEPSERYEQATAAPNEKRRYGFRCDVCGSGLESLASPYERAEYLDYFCPECKEVRRRYIRAETDDGHFRYVRVHEL